MNLLYTLCNILTYFQNSYYRSFGHVVLECRIAFGDIHFLGKLIRFMHFYRHYNFNLQFSFILSTKFFVSPRILTIFNLSVHCFHIVTKISLSLIRSRGVRMMDFHGELFHFFTSTGFLNANLGFPSFLT